MCAIACVGLCVGGSAVYGQERRLGYLRRPGPGAKHFGSGRKAIPPQVKHTNRIVALLNPGESGQRVAEAFGLRYVGTFVSSPEWHILEGKTPEQARNLVARLSRFPSVREVFQEQTSKHKPLGFVPNDPLFPAIPGVSGAFGQWHLVNSLGTGIDARVKPMWDQNFTGLGVPIGIVDDGLQTAHPDLSPNYDPALSRDFASNDADPNPVASEDSHGTAVAGVAAARGGNGIGITGAAPFSKLAGLRISYDEVPETQFADANLYLSSGANRSIKIKNHSYGFNLPFVPADLQLSTLAQSAAAGTIHVFAAGNSRADPVLGDMMDDANKTPHASSPNVITVAALNASGTFAYYSDFGACVFVSAPGGASPYNLITTDRTGANGYNGGAGDLPYPDYTNQMLGTSFATPVVSGVLALLKQAKPNLDVRFAKHLLARSSDQVDPLDRTYEGDWWIVNAAGFKFNQNYGFGLINAGKLLANAALYAGVTPLGQETLNVPMNNVIIPDNASYGIRTFFGVNSTAPMEELQISLNITHPYRGDLTADLISPSGTVSRLFAPSIDDSGTDLSWTFTSNAFWGENPHGTWTLTVYDYGQGDVGRWKDFSVKVRTGTLIPMPKVASLTMTPSTVSNNVSSSGKVTLTAVAPTGGVVVSLSSTEGAQVPATVTVPAGALSATFPAKGINTTASSLSATITATLVISRSAVLTVRPFNSSAFVSQVVPTSMIAGQTYPVSLVFKNTGATTWTAANLYRLLALSPPGNSTWGIARMVLPNAASIAPGMDGTFATNVYAPMTGGSYAFQWQTLQEGIESFGQTSTPVTVSVIRAGDAARYVSASVPAQVYAGNDFQASVSMLNVGLSSWASGYALGSMNPAGNTYWYTNRWNPTAVVAPGQNHAFTRTFTAPVSAGTYSFMWKMNRNGVGMFGDSTPNFQVKVVQGPLNALFVGQSGVPSSVAHGGSFSASLTFKNLGTSAWSAASGTLLRLRTPGSPWGVTDLTLPAGVTVPTGGTYTFTQTFTAPPTPGTYGFQWRMAQPPGNLGFGGFSQNVPISVT